MSCMLQPSYDELIQQAHGYKANAQFNEMKQTAEAAIKLNRNGVDGHLYKGEALIMLGQAKEDVLQEALQWINQGYEALSKALSLCSQANEPKEKEKHIENQRLKGKKVQSLKKIKQDREKK